MSFQEGVLYPDVISRGLQKLGPSPITAQSAYLSLSVENEGLRDIGLLREYAHLQHVNLAGNALEDITPLVTLAKLKTLDLSGNQVQSLKDFAEVSDQSPDSRFGFGDVLGGATLQTLNLGSNRITAMPKQIRLKYLRVLILDNNGIEQISGLTDMRFLRVLSVVNNKISSTDGIVGENLREVYLHQNEIDVLGPTFQDLKSLQVLTLGHNRITSLENLKQCLSLKRLEIQQNLLLGIRQLEYLVDLQHLDQLNLLGNEMADLVNYRSRVIYRLPRLSTLDGETVSSHEKVESQNTYGADVRARKLVHEQFVPEVRFVNPFKVWVPNRKPPIMLGRKTHGMPGVGIFEMQVWDESESWQQDDVGNGQEGLVVKAFSCTMGGERGENATPLYVEERFVDPKQLLECVQIVGQPGGNLTMELTDDVLEEYKGQGASYMAVRITFGGLAYTVEVNQPQIPRKMSVVLDEAEAERRAARFVHDNLCGCALERRSLIMKGLFKLLKTTENSVDIYEYDKWLDAQGK